MQNCSNSRKWFENFSISSASLSYVGKKEGAPQHHGGHTVNVLSAKLHQSTMCFVKLSLRLWQISWWGLSEVLCILGRGKYSLCSKAHPHPSLCCASRIPGFSCRPCARTPQSPHCTLMQGLCESQEPCRKWIWHTVDHMKLSSGFRGKMEFCFLFCI